MFPHLELLLPVLCFIILRSNNVIERLVIYFNNITLNVFPTEVLLVVHVYISVYNT